MSMRTLSARFVPTFAPLLLALLVQACGSDGGDGDSFVLQTTDQAGSALQPVEVRGPFGTVKSKLQGEPLSDLLRRTAEIADKIAVIRSMTHTEADHDRGTHTVLTGFQPSPAITYPSLGAVVAPG